MVIPIDSERLYLLGHPRKITTLSRKGINHYGLWYVSRNYKKLLEKRKIGDMVQIAYDPENVNQVCLVDEMA